jgi:transcriptional regulator with XRE-family HTH domain
VIAARVGDLRRQRWTGKAIAAELGISPATVSRILNQLARWMAPRMAQAGLAIVCCLRLD